METSPGTRGRPTVLAALLFLFGIEMVRFHVASLGWFMRDTVGIGAIDLIPIALIPFVAGIVLPIIARVLTPRAALWVGAVLLLLGRVGTQVIGNPAVQHGTSGVAVAAFVGLLVLLAGMGRQVLLGGVLLGITVDSAVKAQGVTLDLAYRPGVVPLVAVGVVALAILVLVATTAPTVPAGPRWWSALSLVGIGPLLFVHYLVLQAAGWVSAVTGVGVTAVGVVLVVLNAVAFWLGIRFARTPVTTILAAAAVAAAVVLAEAPAVLFGPLWLVAVPAAGVVWSALVPADSDRGHAGPAIAITAGSVVFLFTGFAYYLPLDLRLGFTLAQARMAGAALLVLIALTVVGRRTPAETPVPLGLLGLAMLSVALPLSALTGGGSLTPLQSEGSLRVMSYNIHQAFGTAGDMDVDAVADVILDSGATVVGLQEIPRAGLLNAGTDVLALLGHRLGWEHVAYHGTTDPVWGNAILSRHPFGDVERTLLPTAGTPFQRGYMAVTVDTPIGDVVVVNIHLQHINVAADHAEDPEADLYPVHDAQLGAVVEEWAGRQPAVLVGDLNARPDWQQVQELLAAGWVDSWAEEGEGPGFTANAADPMYRIDYVFHTPDLRTDRVVVIESQASDHFAVVADLMPSR